MSVITLPPFLLTQDNTMELVFGIAYIFAIILAVTAIIKAFSWCMEKLS